MAITDLLDRIPIPPRSGGGPAASGPTFEVELPDAGPVGPGVPLPDAPPPSSADAPETDPPGETSPDGVRVVAARPPLPSYAVALIGGLALLCLALSVALAAAVGDASASPDRDANPLAAGPATPPEPDAGGGPTTTPAAFGADPAPIPVDLITRLEEASEQPLDVELSRLLDAVQHGFGDRSVELEPTLRSYVYRMAARFEWNPDTFRVAVTAPDPDLSRARAEVLTRLFEDAAASGRLQVQPGAGPHALSLVSE